MGTRMPGSGAPVKNSARFIVIGNQLLLARVVERAHPDVMWFKTIADFERWRRHQAKEALPSLSSLVDLLVKSAIRPHRSLPQELKFAFAWLRKQDRVPVL